MKDAKKMKNKNISEAIIEANSFLTDDVLFFLKKARRTETTPRGRRFMSFIFENIKIAEEKKEPLCQDTGMVSFYVPLAMSALLLRSETQKAFEKLRDSQTMSPLRRKPDKRNLPVINRTDEDGGGAFIIRGGGSLNCTGLLTANPSSSENEIISLISGFVKKMSPYCCPPVFVGVCLGGHPSDAVVQSEKILLGDLRKKSSAMEKKIMNEINKSGIGPGGWGGRNTALCVKMSERPCHIATLPVGITVSCWCLRKGKI